MSTQKDYEIFMKKVAEKTGLSDLRPDESGLLSLRIEEAYTLNLQYVEASAKILCFLEITKIPETADAKVYRELLSAGLFGQETGGGYFALEPTENVVVYHYLFDFDTAAEDVEAFTETLEKILSLADLWAARIAELTLPGGSDTALAGAGSDTSLFRV